MRPRLFGIETEYAISALGRAGAPLNQDLLVEELVARAREGLPHLPCGARGMFLSNGARFYIDCGLHPELATPECLDPWDAVRYVAAGERTLARLARRIEAGPSGIDVSQVLLGRSNVDYSGSGSTWGCHESYLHRASPEALATQLIPHLVSRVIYTGAGGFNPSSPGLEFTLSPRSAYINTVKSHDSVSSRGIVHTRNETLSGAGYNRLHIIFGESLCSQTAVWLKVGVTALIVAMVEGGLSPAEGVTLAAPLEALRAVAGDPTCKTEVRLSGGRYASAVAIQRHYLAQAETHRRAGFMPPWAGDVCERWRAVVDRLARAPYSLAGTLDWAIKQPLYAERLRRWNFTWESLSDWNLLLARIRIALKTTEYADKAVPLDLLFGASSPIQGEIKNLSRFVRERGLSWDDLKQYLRMRQELFEVDTLFGLLCETGIFEALDRAGVLEHRVPGISQAEIEGAMSHPPAGGRARLRGEAVRRIAAADGTGTCDWTGVWDARACRRLDLLDPFESVERWTADKAEEEKRALWYDYN